MTTATAEHSALERAQTVAASLEGKPREARFSNVEIREKNDGGFRFVGTAAVFDQLSEDLGGFRELIKRGAFKRNLEDDVRLLLNHDPNFVLARTTSGTLELSEKPKGLIAEADVAEVSYAKDIRVLLERGDVSQMSFAFRVDEDSWFEDDEGNLIRTIHKVAELYDVSIVTYPAYPQTDAGIRALRKLQRGENVTPEEREALEALLADSTDSTPSEQEDRATAQEPVQQAEAGDERPDVEDTDPPGGLSGRSARARLRAIQARI